LPQERLTWRPITVLLLLSLVWGGNIVIIKLTAQEMSPLFTAGLRSLLAAVCLGIWMRRKKMPLLLRSGMFWHGVMMGLLFACNFACAFLGLTYTLVSRGSILIYTAPFFVALGAHFYLPDDRLNLGKLLGLALAFAGIVLLFGRDLGDFSLPTLLGDVLSLASGVFWGTSTLYLKKYLAHRAHPLQNLYCQLAFSAPILFLLSLALERPLFIRYSWLTGFYLFYQCIIVAFISYLVWVHLVHHYPASLLHGFSFFTPVFGVLLGGVIVLGEEITPALIMALVLVSLGTVFVNRAPRVRAPAVNKPEDKSSA